MALHYLDALAGFAADVSYASLSPGAAAAARLILLDTLGAMLAGSAEPENARLAGAMAERATRPAASLIGHTARTDPLLAIFVNATAGVALEVDEGNRWGGGHPAIHVVPGALAVAEERGADGVRLLEALVAGYEVSSRIGGATVPRGNVHSHGTWGTIGTAVAVARLAGYDARAMREVINLAASMSPANTWTPALEGATVRNAYPGRSGMEGLLAVELHRAGFTGLPDAPSDVYGTILADRFDPERALDDWGGPLRIEQNYFKFYACCRYNHPALDALEGIRAREPVRAEDVVAAEVIVFPFGLRMAAPTPASQLAAKFSIPWAVAASLVLGHGGLAAFGDAARGDARIRDLAGRVMVTADAAMTPRRSDYPTSRLRLRLRDGRTLEEETGVVRGDAENPAGEGEVIAKFEALAAPVLGERRARELAATVLDADELKNVAHLGPLLAPAR
ncbi:MAG TPA: MmgE/PrpD family protein [Methylomirabilota bacterium]|nr:MmgE/PrpD family protein [Methylomirabilota bacterium]